MKYTNVINGERAKKVKLKALTHMANALSKSFGPLGSNTTIFKENQLTVYTKDGHTILKAIGYIRPIEVTVKSDLVEITRHIVKTVGDGTTSAVLVAHQLFSQFVKNSDIVNKYTPYQLVCTFNKAIDLVVKEIQSNAKPIDTEAIRSIAMISTNGNEKISNNLADIYEEFGNGVYIDVNISNDTQDIIKIYDGMTIEEGYADNNFINNLSTNEAIINKPNIYVFEDPIDTLEMASLFDSIISNNIIVPMNAKTPDKVLPTVILCSKLSRDLSASMDHLINWLANTPPASRPPLLVVTNINDKAKLLDIAKLCDAKVIQKYIDPKMQQIDIEKGIAPTVENVYTFAGSADRIDSNISTTKIINPKLRTDEKNGGDSALYTSMIAQLQSEIDNYASQGTSALELVDLKRRLNSLKGNMVEYLVGGISVTDRDCTKDLVEDAVLNCRSAALYGYGYGANFEALRALNKIVKSDETDQDVKEIADLILHAYLDLTIKLYTGNMYGENPLVMALNSICNDKPFNLKDPNAEVLSSIKSDEVILQAIGKIVTLMLTSNQFICTDVSHNSYTEEDDLD